MKQLLLLEYLSGGGAVEEPGPDAISDLGPEGFAMLAAVAEDWSRLPGWKVKSLVHPHLLPKLPSLERLEWGELSPSRDWESQWQLAAESADAVIVIAPECGQILQKSTELVDAVTGTRIGCRGDFLRHASDKWLTAECLNRAGIPHPKTMLLDDWESTTCDQNQTAVWLRKPRDGVDAVGIEFLSSERTANLDCGVTSELDSHNSIETDQNAMPEWIVQEWIEGEPCSVAAWIQGGVVHWFPPVYQSIERNQNKLRYCGGYGPLSQAYWPLVFRVGAQTLQALGNGAEGWIGIDFVLRGMAGVDDVVVIEVNPRWTTSYLGLRAMVPGGCLRSVLMPEARVAEWKEQELTPVRWNISGLVD